MSSENPFVNGELMVQQQLVEGIKEVVDLLRRQTNPTPAQRVVTFVTASASFVSIAASLATVFAVAFLWYQLAQSISATKVSVYSQMYDQQMRTGSDMMLYDTLSAVWTVTPAQVPAKELTAKLLPAITKDQNAQESKNAQELYQNMFGAEVFVDKQRMIETQDLRRMFVYIQNEFYQVENIFDYQAYGTVSEGEFRTWKGTIREMHAHPVLLAVIWQGYQKVFLA